MSTVSLPALASSVVAARPSGTLMPRSAEAGEPEAAQRPASSCVLSWLSIEFMPESPNSWPFCRSALVVAVGTRFSVSSERVAVTTAL